MSVTDTGTAKNGGIKTIAFRFKPDLHAQITLIAQLRGHTLQDEVMTAIEAHVVAAKADADLQERVTEARAAIDQEAQERRATIATLFDSSAADDGPKVTPPKPMAANNRSGGRGGRAS